MATRKRSSTNRITPKPKKQKTNATQESSLSEVNDDLLDGYWPIKAIRGERRVGRKTLYLVEWADDPETGETYPERDWKTRSEVTSAAIEEWNGRKEELGARTLLADGEKFVPKRETQPRVRARRTILSSPTTTINGGNTQDSIGSSIPSTTPEGNGASPQAEGHSGPIEVSETQGVGVPIQELRVIIHPLRPSQKESYEELDLGTASETQTQYPTDPFSNGLHSSSGEVVSSSPVHTPPSETHKTTLSSSTRYTIPDSQPPDVLVSVAQPSRSTASSTPAKSAVEAGSASIAHLDQGVIVSDSSPPDSQSFSPIPQVNSPLISSPESLLFDDLRSAREETASTALASDAEILSHSQPATANNSAPSAQLEPVPSIEREHESYVSQPFQTQIQIQTTPSPGQARGDPQLPRQDTDLDGLNLRSPHRIASPRTPQTVKELQNSTQDSSPRSPISPLRAFLRTQHSRASSMARTSRESTPKGSGTSPVVTQDPGMSLQERLKNIRAPAKALADARKKANAITSTLSQSIEPRPVEPTPQPIGAMDGAADSVLESTELPTEMHTTQTSTDSSSASLASAPFIFENGWAAIPNRTSRVGMEEKKPLIPLLGASEYVVALPVEGKMRDQYLELIKQKELDIAKFLQSERKPTLALTESMTSLLSELCLTTSHTDYAHQEQTTQADVSASQEARWADYASTKFAFLSHLIDIYRDQKVNFLIVALPGRVTHGLATYCQGKKIAHTVLGDRTMSSSSDDDVDGSLKIFITSGSTAAMPSINLIIAFDTTDSSSRNIQELRRTQIGVFVPLVHLVVKNSPEHAYLCLPKDMPQVELVRVVVREVVASKRLLGNVDIGIEAEHVHFPEPGQRLQALKREFNIKVMMVAKAVAHCLSQDNFDASWPFPPVAFDSMDLLELPRIPPTLAASPARSRTGTPLGQKRMLDITESPGMKRRRLTPLHDITHISDSLKDPQSQVDSLKEELRKAEQTLAHERKDRADEKLTFETSLSSAQAEASEMTMELRKLEHRYETRTKEVHTMRRAIKNHAEETEAETAKRTKLLADVESLQQQRRSLQEELRAARDALKEGAGGPTADLEIAREQVRQLEKEKASLEKSNANIKKDFEFTRQQYQNASTAAAEAISQSSELETEVASLKILASAEKRKIKETNFTNDRERYISHIAELQATLENRDKMLQRKEEELKAMRRGRGVATRGSSAQPSSPRLVGVVPVGSRGTSPVPGMLSVGRMSALRHER